MKKSVILKIVGIVLFLSVISCATRSSPPAPIVNATKVPAYAQPTPANTGATASNATQTAANNSQKPKLEAVTSDEEVQTKPIESKQTAAGQSADSASDWQMPTEGKLGKYSVSSKGVNITGTEGQPIYAASDGKVLYSGNGLKGYGNLIIIRHDNTYLSAYAYNKKNLVKEGAVVKKGQKIATMGLNDSNEAMLHFEVRKNGKPIDPHSMVGN